MNSSIKNYDYEKMFSGRVGWKYRDIEWRKHIFLVVWKYVFDGTTPSLPFCFSFDSSSFEFLINLNIFLKLQEFKFAENVHQLKSIVESRRKRWFYYQLNVSNHQHVSDSHKLLNYCCTIFFSPLSECWIMAAVYILMIL